MDVLMAIFIGIALSAAVGFRVFTPLLFTSLVTHSNWIVLAEGFEWVGSTPALIAFSVATVIEVLSNYIPFVASFLKILITPLAIGAGILLTASYIGEMDPFLAWTISIIAGGGIAGLTHTTVTAIKGVSETATLGVATPVVSIIEDFTATIIPILVFIAPILAVVIIFLLTTLFIRSIRKLLYKPQQA